jgi:hypothetical protein
MHRRTALQRLAVLLGGIALTPDIMAAMAARAASGEQATWLRPGQQELLAELTETIIPETDTPGAKAAGVDRYISLFIQDFLKPAEQQAFSKGLAAVDTDCELQQGRSFMACNKEQRTAFLQKLEKDAKGQPDPNFWRILKSLTLQGYFTSEIGMTKALAYDPIPGAWIPDMKVDEHTKSWASIF